MKVRKDTPHVKNKKGEYEWRGRIRWIGSDGKERVKQRTAKSKRHAKALADQLAGWLEREGPKAIDAEKLTFKDLADDYSEKKLVPAVYVGDLRVAGQRANQRQRGFLKPLIEYFGAARVQAITYEDLAAYRKQRFQTPTRRDKERSVSHVNRELTLLRAIFNFARRCGYINRSPFEMGEGLISQADETRRDRILTPTEETALLAQCVERRAHLRPLIICALDTAMRKGESFALRWMDVDWERGSIVIRSTTTKTRRGRQVGITARLRAELEIIRTQRRGVKPEDFIFGGALDCKKAFGGARKDAKIQDLRFHDLRHTATTRMVQSGLPTAIVMAITGHTQFSTFKRYVNANSDAASNAAALLEEFNAREKKKAEEKEKPAEMGKSAGKS